MFTLRPDQPVAHELLLIVRDRLDSALDLLPLNESLSPEIVHQLRKRFKRLRALFRIVHGFDAAAASKELIRYRDLGRDLSFSRDRDVMEQSLIKLQFLTDDPDIIFRLESLHGRLERQKIDSPATPATVNSEELRNRLLEARAAAEQILRGEYSDQQLVEGYLQTYSKARKLCRLLPESRVQEDWHNWRKRVKDDWYQTQLLTLFRNDHPRKRLKKLRQLADSLGYDHDLQNLSEMIETLTSRPHPLDEEIQTLLDRQRSDLQCQCLSLGQKLYRRKSSVMRTCFETTPESSDAKS